MNFDQLKIFISVVEHGSFTKAAETMYISHSTTSRNVAALEESLGVRLLMRDSRSVRPTSAGELLFLEGQILLRKAEELEEAVKNTGKGFAGKLTLASVNLYSDVLSSAYKEFCRHYPDVVLAMYHRELSEIVGQVLHGDADLGVSFSYVLPDNMEGFGMKRVSAERFCVIAPADHPIALRKTVKSSDLLDVSYVGVGEQRSEFTRKIEESVLKGRPKSEVLSVPTLESLFLQVQSGNGISLVPYPMAREFGTNCAILDVEDVDTGFDIVMFWRKDNENPSLPFFVDLLTEYEK